MKCLCRATEPKRANEAVAEMSRLDETQTSLQDRVERTMVRAPMNGTIKRLLVNTISGVVKPGMDIMEIVPAEDALLVGGKDKTSDVAYLAPGLEAMKFTAYDYSIHGGLKGKLTFISADTITNEKTSRRQRRCRGWWTRRPGCSQS